MAVSDVLGAFDMQCQYASIYKNLLLFLTSLILLVICLPVIHAQTYTFVTNWGSTGTNNGEFNLPAGVDVDLSGNVYVADYSNNRIQKFNSNGAYITKWGSQGAGNGYLESPYGVAVDSSNNVYVVDSNNDRIQKFSSSGGFISTWGLHGTDNGCFFTPEGVAVDSSGNIYVADTGNNRIQKFNSNRVFITTWGSSGTSNGNFSSPYGVAVDSSGNVYVADTGNKRVQKFNSNGAYITKWGSSGTGNGNFNYPTGITVDSSSNVYVADSNNNCIQKFSSTGRFITKWGYSGSDDGNFSNPKGIAVDSSSNVYVADSNNNRIQKFALVISTPTITWSSPAAITYGTALSSTQLSATASVPGTFTYTPAAGTVLSAGTQTLHVDFTPTDTDNYTSTSKNVTIVVNKATPTITWATPAAINYGTALSGTQLNAACPTTGTFTYNPSIGSVLKAGSQALNTTFTPTDLTNFTTSTKSVSLTVNKATPTITWATPAAINYGTALSGTQLNAACPTTTGTFSYNPAAGTILGATTQTLQTTFTPTDSSNFTTATKNVSLTVNKATPVIIWNNPSAITYGKSLSATQLNAACSTTAGSFVYDSPNGTVLGAGTRTLNTTFTPTDSINYTTATASVSLTVNKAPTIVTWDNPAATTYGTVLSATQLNATCSTTTGTFVYTPVSGTILGTGFQTLHVDFSPTDSTNYSVSSKNVILTINKATPVVTWDNPNAIIYGTLLSEAQLNANSGGKAGTFLYNPGSGTVLGAGSRILHVDFSPSDNINYTTASREVTLVVNKASTTVTWDNPNNVAYGTELSATQLCATASSPGSFVYNPGFGTVLSTGNTILHVDFLPTDSGNYTGSSREVSITITKAMPAITWNNPEDIKYGVALSDTQLNAICSTTSGAFTYFPTNGTVLGAGLSQYLHVTFTPVDTTNYSVASKDVSINVQKADTTITWNDPEGIIYGTPLSTSQLDATASVAGNLVYTSPSGTILSAGTQALRVDFTPTDTDNYTSTSKNVTINVEKSTPFVFWSNPATIIYGTALNSTQLNATALIPGNFTYNPAAGTVLSAGSQTLRVEFTPTDTVNYSTTSQNVTLTVYEYLNISVTKRIEKQEIADRYNVTLNLTSNMISGESNVRVYDLVPENFTITGIVPNFTNYQDNVCYWTIDLVAGESRSVTYTLVGTGIYSIRDTFIVGVDPK